MLLDAQFQPWWSIVRSLGFSELVSSEDDFDLELVSAASWANRHATGIYTWIAENGETYVGQSKSVRRRLRDHRKSHPDLRYAAFQRCDQDRLDEREQELIRKAEAHFPVRNVKFAASSTATVPFDTVISPSDQEKFLDGERLAKQPEWRNWPLLEMKQRNRYEAFIKQPHAEAALNALHLFIDRCIPCPADTEVKFWSTTLFRHRTGNLLRLNAGQQEVFTVCMEGGQLFARPLSQSKITWDSDGPLYETQSWASFVPIDQFWSILNTPNVLQIRKLVIRLMRHSTTLNSGSHCPQFFRV